MVFSLSREITKHILTLINDPALRKKMGEKIHEKASLKQFFFGVLETAGPNIATMQLSQVITALKIDNLRMYRRDLRILVLSRNPLETGLVYNVDSINRFNLLKILLIMRNSKLFIKTPVPVPLYIISE